MQRPIEAWRVALLLLTLWGAVGMARPPQPAPEPPVIGGLLATPSGTSISGEITECIDPNEAPEACKLSIEYWPEGDPAMSVEVDVSGSTWTLTNLQPETTYMLIARASDGVKTASTGPYAYATGSAPASAPPANPYPGVIVANEPAGSLKGGFEIDDSGAASYRLAIVVPPGTAGLEPELAIQYSSQAGNGTLGMGFQLTGLGAITRCAPTDFLNGDADPVDFDDSDLFCLAGERLVLTGGGPYGADGAEYRTTMDTVAKVTSWGGANNDPDYFEVREKHGRIVEYGATEDSRIQVQGRTEKRAWAVNKISDRSGNYLTVTYHEDVARGEYWPVRIDYTANDSANGGSNPPYNKVVFEYGGPPADPPNPNQWPIRPDRIGGYFAGGLVENPYRLTNIKTYARDTAGAPVDLVFDYRITYEQGSSTGVSRITEIKQCTSADPVGPCLPPAQFTWSDDTLLYDFHEAYSGVWIPAIASTSNLTAWDNTHDGYVLPGDVNGDGKTDLVRVAIYDYSFISCFGDPDDDSCAQAFPMTGVAISQGDGTYDFQESLDGPFGHYDTRFKFLIRQFLADVNGDGLDDLIEVTHPTPFYPLPSAADIRISVALSQGDGHFGTWSITTAWTWHFDYADRSWWDFGVADLNGDGRMDLWGVAPDTQGYSGSGPGDTVQRHATIYAAYSNGNGTFAVQPGLVTPWTVPYSWLDQTSQTVLGHWQAVDANGDGMDDIVGFSGTKPFGGNPGPQSIHTAISTGTDFDVRPSQAIAFEWGSEGSTTQSGFWTPLEINGDGNTDLAFLERREGGSPGGPKPYYRDVTDSATRFHLALSRGDGTYQIQTTSWIDNALELGGTGLKFFFYGNEWIGPDSVDPELAPAAMYAHDPDGDGRQQLMIISGKGGPDGLRYVIKFDVDGTLITDQYIAWTTSGQANGVCNTKKHSVVTTEWGEQYVSDFGEFPGDHDGDGREDWICWRAWVEDPPGSGLADTMEIFTTAPRVADPLGDPTPNLITSFSNGADDSFLDPQQTFLTYRPLADSSYYTRANDLGYPLRSVQDSRRVVATLLESDGVGGLRQLDYSYMGLRFDQELHQSVGFTNVDVRDFAAGVGKQTRYRQVFPIQGTPEWTETYQLANDLTIESTDHHWVGEEQIFAGGTVYAARKLQTLTRYYGIDVFEEPPHRSEVEDFDYDLYGNAIEMGRYWIEGNLPDFPVLDATLQDLHQEVTITTYDPPDLALWFVDHVERRTVTARLADPLIAPRSRNTTFDYYPNGQLQTKLIEPDIPIPDPWLYQRTDWTYDDFGNIETVTVGDGDLLSRTQTTFWDSRGQFPKQLQNALGHSTLVEHEPRHGQRVELIDPNGVVTQWVHDALGREIQQLRPDGTMIQSHYSRCDSSCPAEAGASPYVKTSIASDGALHIRYHDLVGRAVLEETNGFLGEAVFVTTEFDAIGRIVGQSRPYFAGAAPRITDTTHDLLDRPLTKATPDGGITRYDYLGLITEITDPNMNLRTVETNARGWTIRSTDPNGESMVYKHDPFGYVTNAWRDGEKSATEVTTTYDLYGRRKTLTDPNAGSWAAAEWTWTYNAFGEVEMATDPNGQLVTHLYDDLGRRTDRMALPGDISTWTYDTSPNGIGKLAAVDGSNGYQRSLSYDSLGRLIHTSYVIDWTYYVSNVTYDSYGRVEKHFYPSGFAVENKYNAQGYLWEVSRSGAGNPGTPIWTKYSAEADGQTRNVTLGNGVTSTRLYDLNTGRPRRMLDRANSGTSTWLQRAVVDFDHLGNLKEHSNLDTGVLETMDYDPLNRLTSVQYSDGSPSISYTYDPLGNLETKTGVGSYFYGNGAGTHAVTRVAPPEGGPSRYYRYDLNGNMTCRGSEVAATCNGGTHISYSWFNKPTRIETPSGAESEFLYDAEHARIRQVATANGATTTTRYVGSTYEKVTKDTVTQHVHHIFADSAAVAQFIDYEDATPDTWRYLHRDHLGSIVSTSDENGALVQRIDFDPHGQRTAQGRSQQAESPELPRGFTGHEHLQDVGLIHMNGRIYDPELGRMLSVDPFVVEPLNLQTYNRYSYVLNNPMSLADPSGYIPGFNTQYKASRNEAANDSQTASSAGSSGRGQPKRTTSQLVNKANKESGNGKVAVIPTSGGLIVGGGNATFKDNGDGTINCTGCRTIPHSSRTHAASGRAGTRSSAGIGRRARNRPDQTTDSSQRELANGQVFEEAQQDAILLGRAAGALRERFEGLSPDEFREEFPSVRNQSDENVEFLSTAFQLELRDIQASNAAKATFGGFARGVGLPLEITIDFAITRTTAGKVFFTTQNIRTDQGRLKAAEIGCSTSSGCTGRVITQWIGP